MAIVYPELPLPDANDTSGYAKKSSKNMFNSREKRIVRNSLWQPIYSDILSSKRHRQEQVSVLCLPGPKCYFIKQLLATKLISNETHMVAVESDVDYHAMEQQFFSEHFVRGRYEVLQGTLEDLSTRPELIGHFPFDILELDLPVCLFSLTPHGITRVLGAIETCLRTQAYKEQPCYLITTFKSGGTLPPSLQVKYADIDGFLIKEVLERENSWLHDTPLDSFLQSHSSASWDSTLCSLYAVPLVIIRHASVLFDVTLENKPFAYHSARTDSTTTLVCHAFKCKPHQVGTVTFDALDNALKDALAKTSNAVRLDR